MEHSEHSEVSWSGLKAVPSDLETPPPSTPKPGSAVGFAPETCLTILTSRKPETRTSSPYTELDLSQGFLQGHFSRFSPFLGLVLPGSAALLEDLGKILVAWGQKARSATPQRHAQACELRKKENNVRWQHSHSCALAQDKHDFLVDSKRSACLPTSHSYKRARCHQSDLTRLVHHADIQTPLLPSFALEGLPNTHARPRLSLGSESLSLNFPSKFKDSTKRSALKADPTSCCLSAQG